MRGSCKRGEEERGYNPGTERLQSKDLVFLFSWRRFCSFLFIVRRFVDCRWLYFGTQVYEDFERIAVPENSLNGTLANLLEL